jgi:hypothetical protein
MKKYKVVVLVPNKPFVPETIEQELNGYAQQGWKVISCVAGKFFVGGFRNELVAFLEKDE